MLPELRVASREEMNKRIALFKDLTDSKGGLIDSHLPGCERELINVIGFQPPKDETASVSLVGVESARRAAIQISEGFNLGFARAKPGNGQLMHNHDSNETFMPINGRWRCAWSEGDDYIDVGPLDVVSFPPGIACRFFNITENKPNVERVMLFIVGGNAPEAAYTPEAHTIVEQFNANAS